MIDNPRPDDPRSAQARVFAAHAARRREGFARELLRFLLNAKSWWLGPIIIVLLLVSFLVILSGTSIAPFIYTLF